VIDLERLSGSFCNLFEWWEADEVQRRREMYTLRAATVPRLKDGDFLRANDETKVCLSGHQVFRARALERVNEGHELRN
jgi:hypothetical protein